MTPDDLPLATTRRDTWPTHPDGRPKTYGDLSAEERREQTRIACAALSREMRSTEFRRGLDKCGGAP